MSIKSVKKSVLNLKDAIQAILSLAMANTEWLLAFNASLLSLLLKPLLGLALMALVFLQAYELLRAAQLGLEQIIQFSFNLACTSFANATIFGGLAASAMHTAFAAGPWLFLTALIIGLTQQLGLVFFNLVKAFRAHSNSIERAEHLQAAVNNLFNGLLLTVSIITLVFALLSSIAPVVLASFAMLGTLLLVANIAWRSSPKADKQALKQAFGLEKPEETSLSISKRTVFPVYKPSRSAKRSLHFWSQEKEQPLAGGPTISIVNR